MAQPQTTSNGRPAPTRPKLKFTTHSLRGIRRQRGLHAALELAPTRSISPGADWNAVQLVASSLPPGFRADSARAVLASLRGDRRAAASTATPIGRALAPLRYWPERARAKRGRYPSSADAREHVEARIGANLGRAAAQTLMDLITHDGLDPIYRDAALQRLRSLMHFAPATGNAIASAAASEMVARARDHRYPVDRDYVMGIVSLAQETLRRYPDSIDQPSNAAPHRGPRPQLPKGHRLAVVTDPLIDLMIDPADNLHSVPLRNDTNDRYFVIPLADCVAGAMRFATILEGHGHYSRVGRIYKCIGHRPGARRAAELRAAELLERAVAATSATLATLAAPPTFTETVTGIIRHGDNDSTFTAEDLVKGGLVAAIADGRPELIAQVRPFVQPAFFDVLRTNLRAHGHDDVVAVLDRALGSTTVAEPETLAEVISLSLHMVGRGPLSPSRPWDKASQVEPDFRNEPEEITARIEDALGLARVSGDDFGI